MKKILFTLSLLVIFTNCSGEETTEETSAQQDTTNTTQQDTTTPTQQDTTTTTQPDFALWAQAQVSKPSDSNNALKKGRRNMGGAP